MSGLLHNEDSPTVSRSGSPGRGEDPGELPEIKDYDIMEKLGEGGIGIVYLAEQKEPIHRRVALKVVKPGGSSVRPPERNHPP